MGGINMMFHTDSLLLTKMPRFLSRAKMFNEVEKEKILEMRREEKNKKPYLFASDWRVAIFPNT